jgi:primosomal protein N' (replication factor Y)
MDQDTTKGKTGHIDIIEAFERREADILLGTQMVSKGLNFPGVALVGVLAADVGLHFPDFRAQERTFQLLSQVAGRAGRADSEGEVVIQTYFPEDSAIVAAKSHDYIEFYNKEIIDREALSYPPFGKLARILVTGKIEANVRMVCSRIAKQMETHTTILTLGPAKAAWERLKNDYRYCFLIKSGSPRAIRDATCAMRKAVVPPRDVRVVVDIDPVNML